MIQFLIDNIFYVFMAGFLAVHAVWYFMTYIHVNRHTNDERLFKAYILTQKWKKRPQALEFRRHMPLAERDSLAYNLLKLEENRNA